MSPSEKRLEVREGQERVKVATSSGEDEELKRLLWIDGSFERGTLMWAFMDLRLTSGRYHEEQGPGQRPPQDSAAAA